MGRRGCAASGATAGTGRNIAIDLSANSSGATIKQTVVAATFTAPSIVGDVKFGSGNDLLDLADGSLTGNVAFGGGTNRYALSGDAISRGSLTFGAGNDIMTLAGSSSHTGALDFGGGSDQLAISGTAVFSGQLTNASGAAVSVASGGNAPKAPASARPAATGTTSATVIQSMPSMKFTRLMNQRAASSISTRSPHTGSMGARRTSSGSA